METGRVSLMTAEASSRSWKSLIAYDRVWWPPPRDIGQRIWSRGPTSMKQLLAEMRIWVQARCTTIIGSRWLWHHESPSTRDAMKRVQPVARIHGRHRLTSVLTTIA